MNDDYNEIIICKINIISKNIIQASNGPIICIIDIKTINNINFHFNKENIIHKKSKNKINTTNFIKIFTTLRKHSNNKQIIIGFLDDIATAEEINKFYY